MKIPEKQCFVCKKDFPAGKTTVNQEVMLPVCNNCKGTEK